MPSLGSLFYTLGIKDMTEADLQKVNTRLKNLGFDIKLTPKILKDLTQSAVPKGIKIELDPTIRNEALARAVEGKAMRVAVTPLLTGFREAIIRATRENPPQAEIGVQEGRLRTIIQNVLNRQGFMLNVSTVNDNYSKAIQAKLNGTRYNVKIHADANEITRSVQASLMQVQSRYFGLQVSREILYRSIDEALGQKRFSINIAVQHDQARKAVQDALLRAQVIGKDQALAYQRLQTGEMKAAQAELLRLKAAHQEAANAAKAHATASVNLGGAMGSNIKIAGELGSAMTSLYSIHAAKQFLSQVIEIGGELEHQKIAMNTIFGDKGKTNVLFEQVKGLARTSPFGVMELSKSVKALSAYGVQYNEIYDTAKRLADISAATSVDINRLILAFGKTKSRGFLDGLEARQFAYANIPIYEMVRKKLEELEGQAITTADVMARMRKREISFDIVKDVLWDITDPGGKFYNMQEALAGSVKTSWKLVRDNIELMFGEIAEGAVGNTLKSTAEILQGLTREWRTVGTVVAAAAVGYGVFRVATVGLNQVMQKGTATAYQNLMAEKQRDAQRLRSLSLVMDLTAAEKARIATANRLTNAELAQALKTEKLTLAQIEQLFVTGKLNKANIMYLFRMGLIDKEGARAILTHNRLAISIKGVGMAMASAGKAIGAFLLNPWTIGIAAVTTLIGLWQRHSEKIEETKENIKQLGETAREGSKNLSAEVERLNAQNSETMVSSEFLNSIEEMKNVLKDYDPTWMDAFKEAFSRDEAGNVKSLAEQYDILKQAVIDTAEAYKILSETKNFAYDAHEETDGAFDKSLKENIKAYLEAQRSFEKSLSKMLLSPSIEKVVKAAMDSSPEYRTAVDGKPLRLQVEELVRYTDAWRGAYEAIGRTDKEARQFFEQLANLRNFKIPTVNDALAAMQADEDIFAGSLKKFFEGLYGGIENWSEPVKKAFITKVRKVYSEVDGISKEEADKMANQYLTTKLHFKITTDFELDSQQLNDWKAELDNLTKGQFTTIIRMAPDYLTALSEIQKATDEAQKKLNDAKLKMPIDIQLNGDFGMTPNQIPGWSVMSSSAQNAATSMLGWLKQLAGANAGNITPTPQKPKGGTTKDTLAESLKQRFKDIKDAWSEFQKWSKTEGREAAATRIGESGLFSTLSKDKIPQTVEQYRALVVELENELRKAGVKGTARESLLNDLLKQLLDIDKTVVDEQLKLALDKVSKEAERQLADWNLFDKIRKATGNQDLAMSVAFGMNADATTDYPALVKKQFSEVAKAAGHDLTFDNTTLKEAQDLGDEIAKSYQDTASKLEKYAREQKDAIADILNEYQSLQDKLAKIDADRQRKIDAVNRSDMSAPDKAKYIQRINVKADYEKFMQGADYLKFFSGIYSLTMDKAQEIGDKIRLYLDKQLQDGSKSAEDYYKEIERINQQLAKLRNVKSDALTFLTGGVKGLGQKKLDIADSNVLSQMTKVQEAQEALEKAKATGDLKQIAAAEMTLRLAKTELDTRLKVRDAIVKDMESWQKVLDVVNVVNNIAGGMSDAFNSIRDMADAFGFDTESNDWLNVGGVIDTLTSVTSGVSKVVQSAMNGDIGGILGGVVSTVTSPFTIWAQLHDKKLQKMIERSKEYSQQLQNINDAIERRMDSFLGNAKFLPVEQAEADIRRLEKLNKEASRSFLRNRATRDERDRLSRREQAYREGGAYGYQRQLMAEQLAELEKQRQAEIDKKKTDKSVVTDYENQIDEMKVQIRQFAEEAANAMYGIDLNGWASQIGDALVDAFAKGEDAAEAFDRVVGDIMRSLVSKMISTSIIAPMFEDVKKYLFGSDGLGGAFGKDFELDESEAATLGQMLQGIKKGIGDSKKLYDQVNELLGGTLDDVDSKKGGLSAEIQSVTEDTADLLASYLNATRASTAMIEQYESSSNEYLRMTVEESFPRISAIVESQLRTQEQIAANTLLNAKMATEIRDILKRNIQGGGNFRIS